MRKLSALATKAAGAAPTVALAPSKETRSRSLTATRTLSAVALLLIGGIHYQQYRYAFYSVIPTIGPLFIANFVAATALGLFLLAPVKSRLGHVGKLLDQLAALAGVGVAAGGLAALLISEHTPLFGFMEHGYRFVIVLTITSEALAIAMLTLFLIRSRTGEPGPGTGLAHKRFSVPPASEPINQ
jgi:hypothetical protein